MNNKYSIHYNPNQTIMCVINHEDDSILTVVANKIYSDTDNFLNWEFTFCSTLAMNPINIYMKGAYVDFKIYGEIDDTNNLIIKLVGFDGNAVHSIIVDKDYNSKYGDTESYGYMINKFMGKIDNSLKNSILPVEDCKQVKKPASLFDMLKNCTKPTE